jgi:hypothetical protein
MKVLLRALVAVAVAGPLLAGCSSRSVRLGEARVEPHGTVRVAKPGGSYTPLTKASTMKADVRVLVDAGRATVRLPTAELDLRPTTEVRVGPGHPELLAGDLLVVPGRHVLTVTSAGSALAITGAARLSRTFSVSTASYEGNVQIVSAGSKLAVPALRQATVPALGQVPAIPEPLRYDAADKWDRRFLADAIDLGTELQARSDAANAQFRGQGTTPGFYRLLMPQLDTEPGFDGSSLQPSRSPGENLVGAGIATVGKQGDFRARWDGLFAFRGQGAAWGLVALEQGVLRVPGLLTTIDDALGRARLPGEPAPVAIGGPGATTTTSAPNVTAPTTVTTGPRGTTSTTRGSSGGGSTSTTQPPIVAVPHVPATGQPTVDQLTTQGVDTINGLLPRKP